MIRKALTVLIMGIAVIISGCVPSLHPIYTSKDLVFEPDLVGTWTEDGNRDTWQFIKASDNSYTLIQTDDQGNVGKFTVHLAKIKGTLFMDCFPDNLDHVIKEKINGYYTMHLVPAHTILHVKQITPTLQLSVTDYDWVRGYLKDHPAALAHEMIEKDMLVLTADTKALQQFWTEHLNTPKAFGDPSDMKKLAEK